jgi:hypothetical protein
MYELLHLCTTRGAILLEKAQGAYRLYDTTYLWQYKESLTVGRIMRITMPQLGSGLLACATFMGAAVMSISGVNANSYLDPVQVASWDYQDYSLPNPNNVGVWGADITPDGNYIVLAERQLARVRVIDIDTGVRLRTATVGSAPSDVDIDSTGTYAWVMNSNSISRVTIASGTATTLVSSVCPTGSMRDMALTPNDQYLTVTCADQWNDAGTSLHIIKISDASITSVTNSGKPLIRLAMSPTGNFVYASSIWGQQSGGESWISRIAIPSGTVDNTFSVTTTAGSTTTDGAAYLAMNGNGTVLYVASNNGVLAAWNNLGGTPSRVWATYLGHGGLGNVHGPSPIVIDHARQLGYLVYHNQGGLWPEVMDVYNMATGTRATRIVIDHQWTPSIAISDDGQTLVTSGNRFSNMYKYRIGQAVTTTTSTIVTTTTTTTTPPTTTTTTTTTTTAPSNTTTLPTNTTVAPDTAPVVDANTSPIADSGNVVAPRQVTTPVATTTTTTTTTTLPPAAQPSAASAPDAPDASPGGAKLTVNGSTAELSVQRADNKLSIIGSGVEITVSALDENGTQIALDADGNLRVTDNDKLVIDASGFGPEQDLDAWLFSTPTNLGTVRTNSAGSVSGTFDVPSNLAEGEHRLVLKSASEMGEETIVAIGILAGVENSGASGVSIVVGVVLGLALLLGLIIPVVIRRRDPQES